MASRTFVFLAVGARDDVETRTELDIDREQVPERPDLEPLYGQ